MDFVCVLLLMYLLSFFFFPDHDEALTKTADEPSTDKSYAIHSVPLARGTFELSVCWPRAGTRIA